ncbi:hypothetical protein J4204_02350 [Candidatus Woesearchaeota archaeon]|nr:hypothetical protein [Candidatus Woesearchaeota archaeon]
MKNNKLIEKNKHNITALINVEKVTASNIQVYFRGENIKQDFTLVETKTINVNQYQNQNVSVLWDLNKTDFVSVYVDFTNVVAEVDESNNYIRKAARPATKAYVDIAIDYSVLTSIIQNYLDDYIDIVSSGQDVNIYIGRKNSNIPKVLQETNEKPKQKWGLINNIVNFNSKSEGLPYNGIVVRSGSNIYIFGNEIDGDIAALRKLVDNQEFYFSKSSTDRVDYISEEDLEGLFVFDYLHTDENQAKYRKNNANFAKVVENVLNSDVSTIAIKRVLTYNDNTSLRIKHVNAELSPKFRNFSNSRPVAMAGGLWSDLFSFESFGKQLATSKITRDIWLIEITGGPNTECSTCPTYTYNDTVDYYFPALLGGVLKYANKQNADFVGYSLNGRIGLDSINKYENGKNFTGYYNNGTDWINMSLPSDAINHFVGIGIPGAFNYSYLTRDVLAEDVEGGINKLGSKGINHPNSKEFYASLFPQCLLHIDLRRGFACTVKYYLESGANTSKLSRLVLSEFVDAAKSDTDSQPGNGYSPNQFSLIYGYKTIFRFIEFNDQHDDLVPIRDSTDICNQINSQNKKLIKISARHGELGTDSLTADITYRLLNNLSLTNEQTKNNFVGGCI